MTTYYVIRMGSKVRVCTDGFCALTPALTLRIRSYALIAFQFWKVKSDWSNGYEY